MKTRLIVSAFVVAMAETVSAQWHVRLSEDEPGATTGVEHYHVTLENSDTGAEVNLDLATAAKASTTLRVVDNANGSATLADAMEQTDCVVGVNGGYFDPNFAPIGLLIAGSRTIAPLQRARLLTGVLFASPSGAQIVRLREFSHREKVAAAVECGPFLVDSGRPVAGLDGNREARRTFAAVDRSGGVLLGICSPTTLAEMATVLTADFSAHFQVYRALNLDGGSSTGFWFKRKNGSVYSVAEEKSVRDFVGLAPRTSEH